MLPSIVRLVHPSQIRLSTPEQTGHARPGWTAVGFAGLLVIILRGDEVRGILTDLIRRALTVSV